MYQSKFASGYIIYDLIRKWNRGEKKNFSWEERDRSCHGIINKKGFESGILFTQIVINLAKSFCRSEFEFFK